MEAAIAVIASNSGNEDNLVDHTKLVEEPEYAETVVPGDCVYTLAFVSRSKNTIKNE